MKNNKSIYIVGIFMLITMVSIGYAILTGQLNINGSAKVKAAKWDIYFKNVKIKDGSVTASVAPSISNKTTVNFEVELKKPGDFYEFNVDVVNDGMIDAMIESINITPELTANQQKYLSYSVTYYDDVPLEVKDILHAQKSRKLKVRVEYLKSVGNGELNSSDETLNIKATIKYVQADNTAKESTSLEADKPSFKMTKITGDGTQAGDELAIGDEHFYVISNDGENITMLSKYNLNATKTYDSSMTYVQNTNNAMSPVAFSSTNYWGNIPNWTYIYDDRSNLKPYIDNYKNYLESFGAEIKDARVIKREELELLKCNLNSYVCGLSWLQLTQFWTGAVYSTGANNVFIIQTNGYLNKPPLANNENIAGIRPVIVIPASSI